ncbi:redoxin domain-containing protein [Dawidia soli]|uniref:TlpA family protein disulfide reductase n=1 Tax=Dawidia soli TaxID=2782352 RepID=A0AAP2GBA6_9BACT|nr:redoxin domain-containing protein [Dawidia soli]MBT1684919.1 TlpA family protein disulfide reductase [Dawidia soli]
MKTIITSILLLCAAMVNAQHHYTVEVDLSSMSGKPRMLYLWYDGIGSGSEHAHYDSAVVVHGKAQFRGTVAMSGEAYLTQISQEALRAAGRRLPDVTHGDALKFYLEPAALTIYCSDSLSNYVVAGGRYSNDYRQLKKVEDEFLSRRDCYYYPELERVYADSAGFKKLLRAYEMVEGDYYNITLRNFVLSHPNSLVSLLALRAIQRKNGDDLRLCNMLLKSLSSSVTRAPEARDIRDYRNTVNRTAVGVQAPVFSLANDIGEVHTLWAYRGSYVLLEFWSSSCEYCPAEYRKLKDLYEQYGQRKFAILGISLGGFNGPVAKLYGIQDTPQNYLIDPKGYIVAKNLWGDELDAKLKEIFRSWQLESYTTPVFDKVSRKY